MLHLQVTDLMKSSQDTHFRSSQRLPPSNRSWRQCDASSPADIKQWNGKTSSMAGGLDSSLALSKRIKKSHENAKLMLTCAKTDPFHLHWTFCPCCHSRVLLANCVKNFFDFHSKRTADLESHRSSCTPEVRQDCTKASLCIHKNGEKWTSAAVSFKKAQHVVSKSRLKMDENGQKRWRSVISNATKWMAWRHDTKARPARVLGSWFHLYLGAIGRIPAQENQGPKYWEIISDFDSQEEKSYHSQIIWSVLPCLHAICLLQCWQRHHLQIPTSNFGFYPA